MALRLFIGIGFESELATQVETWMKKLRKTADKKELDPKWTPKENLHVTLVFLGNTETEARPRIEEALARVAERRAAFALKIRNVGAFPSIEQARVLWLGVQKSQALLDLQSDLEAELGLAMSEDYMPHMTIARLRNPKGCRDLLSPFAHADFGRQEVREVILYQSIQAGAFPVYKPLHRFELRGQACEIPTT